MTTTTANQTCHCNFLLFIKSYERETKLFGNSGKQVREVENYMMCSTYYIGRPPSISSTNTHSHAKLPQKRNENCMRLDHGLLNF